VETAWGQELQVFAQNLTAEDPIRLRDQVTLTWEPAHTFGLDGNQDLTEGVDQEIKARRLKPAADSLQVGG
jgi:spermidine/putrescine transport system ATP-binding protein